MNEILELFEKCYNSFYIGKDEDGWLYFSELIEKIQFQLSDEHLDVNFKNVLLKFINSFEKITELKKQKNYSLLADILYETHNELRIFKEFN